MLNSSFLVVARSGDYLIARDLTEADWFLYGRESDFNGLGATKMGNAKTIRNWLLWSMKFWQECIATNDVEQEYNDNRYEVDSDLLEQFNDYLTAIGVDTRRLTQSSCEIKELSDND